MVCEPTDGELLRPSETIDVAYLQGKMCHTNSKSTDLFRGAYRWFLSRPTRVVLELRS